jgi:hypothetical protein
VHLEAIREAGAFGLGRLVAVADPFLRSHPEVSQELARDGVRCYAEDRFPRAQSHSLRHLGTFPVECEELRKTDDPVELEG